MKLYLVRHGQSTGNIGGTLMGQSDHPLTELGEAQARAAAARLAPFGPMPVHCSDLPRAVATAEHIVGVRRLPAPIAVEASPTRACARSTSATTRAAPGRSSRPTRSSPAPSPPTRTARHCRAASRWRTSRRGCWPPCGTSLPRTGSGGGLSTDAVATSDASALATGFHAAEPGENACIVAHDGPIRAILNHYLGVPPEKWWTLSTTHGGVSLLEFAGGWVNVRYVNATSHLAGLGDTVYVPSDDG